MRRTALVVLLPAAVIAADWLRLEQPRQGDAAIVLAVLALLPAFAPSVRLRIAAALPAAFVAGRIAFATWHPWTMAARFGNGFLDFYDVPAPFDPRVHQDMRGAILVAVFDFCLVLGLAAAARRPVLAVLVVVLGAGWPSTLLTGGGALGRGSAILVAALVLLAGLTRRPVPRPALPAAVVLALLALVTSTSSAVAKQEIVHWQGWDFYNRPQAAVSVSYVWDSQYGGIHFPKLRTTVFKVKGPSTSLYWRATTLDEFDGVRWVESRPPGGAQFAAVDGKLAIADPRPQPALQQAVRRRARQHIEVEHAGEVAGPEVRAVEQHRLGVGLLRQSLAEGAHRRREVRVELRGHLGAKRRRHGLTNSSSAPRATFSSPPAKLSPSRTKRPSSWRSKASTARRR